MGGEWGAEGGWLVDDSLKAFHHLPFSLMSMAVWPHTLYCWKKSLSLESDQVSWSSVGIERVVKGLSWSAVRKNQVEGHSILQVTLLIQHVHSLFKEAEKHHWSKRDLGHRKSDALCGLESWFEQIKCSTFIWGNLDTDYYLINSIVGAR